jgi:PilZ domain-containing protein
MPGPEPMIPGAVSERRRSERFLLDVPLVVRGESAEQQPFEEQTFSISISTYGALVVLAHKVKVGQKLFLKNPETQYEAEGRVARLGSPYGGLAQVGIEFPKPASELWTISSPLKH